LGGVATGAEDVKRLCHGPTLGRGAGAYQMKGFTGNAEIWHGLTGPTLAGGTGTGQASFGHRR
jgi:hypothetical protein